MTASIVGDAPGGVFRTTEVGPADADAHAFAGKGEGRATVNGELATNCELMFVIVDAE